MAEYIKRNNLSTPFRDGVPGKDWFLAFKMRNSLSIKKPQNIEFARSKMCDPFVIYEYFNLLKKTLDELNLYDKPDLIWNMDETSLSIDPSKTKVVGAKGLPSTRITSTSGRENVTILSTVSASGKKAPPLIIFKAKFIWDQWMADENESFPGMSYAATRNGWMESDVFLNFMKSAFLKAIGDTRPVLLVYDGHRTHVDQRVIEFARTNSINILKLPPHTTHLLQPLDLSVFKSFKADWDQQLCKWQRHNIGRKVPKKFFSQIVGKTWKNVRPEIIQNGFRKAGIYPFNPDAVPRENFNPDSLKRWEHAHNNQQKLSRQINDNQEERPGPSRSQEEKVSDNQEKRITKFSAEDIPDISENQELPSVTLEEGRIADQSTDFKQLLLNTVKQTKPAMPIKKKRVAAGTAVITQSGANENVPKNKKTEKKYKKSVPISSSESESSTDFQEPSEDDNFIGNIETAENENIFTDVEVGSYALIRFSTKKTVKYYIGKIVDQNDDGFEVKFLRKTKANKFCWPHVDDVAMVEENDIERILPNPQIDHWGKLSFNEHLTSYNLS